MRKVAQLIWNPLFLTFFRTLTHYVALFGCIFSFFHMSHVLCHSSHVPCHMSLVTDKKFAITPLTKTCSTSLSGCFVMANTDKQTDMDTLWTTWSRGPSWWNSQTVRTTALKFWDNVYHPLCQQRCKNIWIYEQCLC